MRGKFNDKTNSLPNYDDGEIEKIPSVAQVSALVRHEAVRYDLHDALGCENYKEKVLDFFLKKKSKKQINSCFNHYFDEFSAPLTITPAWFILTILNCF